MRLGFQDMTMYFSESLLDVFKLTSQNSTNVTHNSNYFLALVLSFSTFYEIFTSIFRVSINDCMSAHDKTSFKLMTSGKLEYFI